MKDVRQHYCFLPNPLILNNGPSFGVQTNRFGSIISWATNVPVVVEACTSLADHTWSPLSANTLANGSAYFSDPQWTNYPGRFYRIRSPGGGDRAQEAGCQIAWAAGSPIRARIGSRIAC